MQNIEKNARIIWQSVVLETKILLEYKINLVFDIVARLADAFFFFAFWAVILGNSLGFAGWDFKGFLLIFAFESYFMSIVLSFSYGFLSINKAIHKAELDQYLTKPATTWLLAAAKEFGVNYPGIISGTIALIVAAGIGISINPAMLAIIALMIILGAVITSLFGLCLGTMAFWLGRLESLEEIFNCLWDFQGRPANIFPRSLQVLTAITFPFIFIQTIPAQAILGQVPASQLLLALGIEALIIIAWFFAFTKVWKKGLKVYASGGG